LLAVCNFRGTRQYKIGADYDSLIDPITTTIGPHAWDEVGGPGSVTSLDNAGALIISQTRDVHKQIENLLIALRRLRTHQGMPSISIRVSSQRASSRLIAGTLSHAASSRAQAWLLPQVYQAEK
jgi:hypothetical protein